MLLSIIPLAILPITVFALSSFWDIIQAEIVESIYSAMGKNQLNVGRIALQETLLTMNRFGTWSIYRKTVSI